MPETISPARGSRNLTPRIEPPKVETNNTRSASFHEIEEHQVFEEKRFFKKKKKQLNKQII
jgi:hypothetical protein